jgi:cytochrome c oxidase assembly protein subunit 15
MACLLVCAVFPLIWVGGLVTTYDAGMAVPDWPNTYGYNLLLYPWQTWIAGPWDLFIEHGHRLLGALAGMLTIALVACVWIFDRRLWMRFAGIAALALVTGQGVLGGQRVLLDSRTIAMVHGCVGPAFFALCVAMAVLTSRWWRRVERTSLRADMVPVSRLAMITTALAYLQLILGAQLRHRDTSTSPSYFQAMVVFHLLLAAALLVHAVLLARRIGRLQPAESNVSRVSMALLGLVALQITLGASTWIFKYGWPDWFSGFAWAQRHVNVTESLPQVLITTAHVATGSLILATALVVALRSARLARWSAAASIAASLSWEAAR